VGAVGTVGAVGAVEAVPWGANIHLCTIKIIIEVYLAWGLSFLDKKKVSAIYFV
jgi:hypothetical protein